MSRTYRLRKLTVLVLLLLPLVFASSPLFAALDGAMYIEGATQGQIEGGNAQAGREGSFEVNEMHHLIRHDSTGTEHREMIVTVLLGKGIPKLLSALDEQEQLAVLLDLYQPARTGEEEKYYAIELSGARLVAAETLFPDNKVPENMQFRIRVRLRFAYGTIEHLHVSTGEQVSLDNP